MGQRSTAEKYTDSICVLPLALVEYVLYLGTCYILLRFIADKTCTFPQPQYENHSHHDTSFLAILSKYNVSPEIKVLLSATIRKIVPYFYDTLAVHFLMLVSPLTTRFLLTMVVSGIGPYHCLRPENAPVECAGVTLTPWEMTPMLDFVSCH
jgi:hypothetical protein